MVKCQRSRRRVAKKRKPAKRRTKRAAKCKVTCPSRCPRKKCVPLEMSNTAFDQFLAEMRKKRKSHMTSVETRREAERLWCQMDDDEKEKYVLLAQKAPYVFLPKDKYLCEVICSIRIALGSPSNINLVELIRAACNMCHWKRAQLKYLSRKPMDILNKRNANRC